MYKRYLFSFLIALFFFSSISYSQEADTLVRTEDTTALVAPLSDRSELKISDDSLPVKNYVLINGRKKFPPYLNTQKNKFVLRNREARFGRKFVRGAGLVLSMQAITYSLLFATPESISKWDRSVLDHYGSNMKEAFTKPPVVDGDHCYINYLGHPFQGSYYYNAYRAQGAPFWQCALLSIGHSACWEYLIESGIERPSVQDRIVTPVVGSFMGEFFHFATMRMARNGFKWYEAATICVINPMFALNNGFKFAKKKKEF